MSDATYAEWAIVVFLFGFMCVYSFAFGVLVVQVALRLKNRGKDTSFHKWGAEKELLRPISLLWVVILGILVVIGTVFAFLMAFASTVLVTEATTSGFDRFQYTLIFAMYASLLGISVESERIKKITEMTRTLDNLRETFHQRFSASELLSMYEALRPAPQLFWEEYAGLPDEEVGYDTNRSYRERAAPYSHSQSSRHNRIIIAVAALTLLLTAILATKELLA